MNIFSNLAKKTFKIFGNFRQSLLTSGETGTSFIPEQKQKLSPLRIGVPSLQLWVFIPEQPSLGISQNGAYKKGAKN